MKKTVLIQRFEIRKTRKDENYASLVVNCGKDRNYSSIAAKIWQFDKFANGTRASLSQGSVIEASYRQEEYNGATQWTIEDFRVLDGPELDEAKLLFVQPSRIDASYYRRKLDELIDQTDAQKVTGEVLRDVFDRAEFREAFYKAPAAKSRHQNYPGGLLEHTINVTTLALALADSYSNAHRPGLTFNTETLPVDRTVLIAAGLLHDIGKIDTYRLSPLAETTDANSFEGHLPISYAILRELTRPARLNPPYASAADEIDKLLNCILSHHGSLEFGSPVVPACAEAFILSQADLTDARLSSMVTEGNQALRQNPGTRWLKSHDFAGGIFIGDWPEPPSLK